MDVFQTEDYGWSISVDSPWRCSRSTFSDEAGQQSDPWSVTGSLAARRQTGSRSVGRRYVWSPGTHWDPSGPAPAACYILGGCQGVGCQDTGWWPGKTHDHGMQKPFFYYASLAGGARNNDQTIGYLRVFLGVFHDFPPEPFHRLVTLALSRQLTIDVLRAEDRLQVEPLSLTQKPLV